MYLGFSVWSLSKCTVSSEIREDNKSADTAVVRERFTQEARLCRAGLEGNPLTPKIKETKNKAETKILGTIFEILI